MLLLPLAAAILALASGNGWAALGIGLGGGFLIGYGLERVLWSRKSPAEIEAWVQGMLEKIRQELAEKARQQAEVLEKAKQGTFSAVLLGEKIGLGGVFCYYRATDLGMRVTPGNRSTKNEIVLGAQGIELGELSFYKSKTAAAADIGGLSVVGMASNALTTETIDLSIAWADMIKCMVGPVKQSEYYFLFYRHPAKDREEWIAVYLFYQEERQLFEEHLEQHGVNIEHTTEPLITYRD